MNNSIVSLDLPEYLCTRLFEGGIWTLGDLLNAIENGNQCLNKLNTTDLQYLSNKTKSTRNIKNLRHVLADLEKEMTFIKSGIRQFDELFGGKGIRSKSIVELVGNHNSGKTLLCTCLGVGFVLQENRGLGRTVYYIDTEGDFSFTGARNASLKFPGSVNLENLFYIRVFSVYELISVLYQLESLANNGGIAIVIIDNPGSLLVKHMVGGGSGFDGSNSSRFLQSKLINLVSTLIEQISIEHKIPFIITNEMKANLFDKADVNLEEKSRHVVKKWGNSGYWDRIVTDKLVISGENSCMRSINVELVMSRQFVRRSTEIDVFVDQFDQN
ncbi:hypothetical protein BB559_002102 [Furculomyces boomerangus]|uniref:RecA family profile 1 domain-containing protein n=2 Tax=Harpellales TaxID=61421 RepID=A0A2T9YY10_9FUNG|nr:hypothetical protein BB559_002102 [Furculomyces boomerangus]PWA02245.1 hypothetical protein BB558_001620 [Smittium angustum]